jgi:hypothetical protein
MPSMLGAQTASWHGVMDLHERMGSGWLLVGGQMVHLHCAEHGYVPTRATNDVDTVVDVRADRDMLRTFTVDLPTADTTSVTVGNRHIGLLAIP